MRPTNLVLFSFYLKQAGETAGTPPTPAAPGALGRTGLLCRRKLFHVTWSAPQDDCNTKPNQDADNY